MTNWLDKYRAEKDAANLRKLVASLEKQLPPPHAILLLLEKNIGYTLSVEAERRAIGKEKLANLIVTMVAKHNLFKAVLDP